MLTIIFLSEFKNNELLNFSDSIHSSIFKSARATRKVQLNILINSNLNKTFERYMNNAKLNEKIITVKDLMTRRIISVLPETTVIEAVKVMSTRDISSLLIITEGKYIGIFTDRDVMKKVVALGLDPNVTMAKEIMSSPLITISEDTNIEVAAEKMRDSKIRRLVVKNDIEVVGVISESDIARVEPELHLLIREHTRLQLPSSNYSDEGENFAGYCEECNNYSSLENLDGRWLCKECR
jgi:CBS domain-containing protein